MKINEKIYSLRKEAGLSQEELADKLGVSRQTVSKWELGDSTPDFDKIVPLCEVFNISSEELLTDKKKVSTKDDANDNAPDTKKALLICFAIFLYFIGVVSVIFGSSTTLKEEFVVSIFLLICGIATCILIFTAMTRPSKVKKEINDEEIDRKMEKDPVLKSIISIVTLITTFAYLLISFMTMAWHLTWLIWIIYSIIIKIIELSFTLKEVSDEK